MRLRKTTGLGIILAILLLAAPAAWADDSQSNQASEAQPQKITVLINGEEQDYEVSPVLKGGVVLVPMRAILEPLGADIQWANNLKEVTTTKGETTVILKEGSTTAFVNDRVKIMTAAPILEKNTLMIPLRFISENFGCDVAWDGKQKMVSITFGEIGNLEADGDAESTEEKNQSTESEGFLSYDYAGTRAQRYNASYQNAVLSAERAKLSNDSLKPPISFFVAELEQSKKALTLAEKTAYLQLGINGETLEYSIEKQMDDINIMLLEKNLLEDKIKFLNDKKDIETIKFEYGVISHNDLLAVLDEIANKKQELKVLDKKIEGAYVSLNVALNYPPEQRDELEFTLQYEPIEVEDLDRYIKEKKSDDPYLWALGQQINLQEFNLLTYTYNEQSKSWALTKLDLTQAKQNSDSADRNFDKVMQERYNNLQQLEESIVTLELGIDQAKKAVNTLRLQYDMGMITKIQLEEAQQAMPDLRFQIKKLQLQHMQLKELFDKPYLSPEYAM